jgi:uncharacterized membrane protein
MYWIKIIFGVLQLFIEQYVDGNKIEQNIYLWNMKENKNILMNRFVKIHQELQRMDFIRIEMIFLGIKRWRHYS